MTAFPVIVRAGRDYWSPPSSGASILPATVLTNPNDWQNAAFGYDHTQPDQVAVPLGMQLSWTTDPGVGALQGVFFDAVAGESYTLSLTVRALAGAARWRASVGWTASTEWATPDGYNQTLTLSWTAPETRAYLWGVETFGPTTSTHTVIAVGVWRQSDPTIQWRPRDLDKCKVALPVQVTHGRSTADSQPDAPSCTFTYLGSDAPTVLGDTIELEVAGAPGSRWTDPNVLWTDIAVTWLGTRGRSLRFRGYVTSLRAIEAEGFVVAWQVEATGGQSRLGRVKVMLSRPAESDVQRVAAISAAAGIPVQTKGAAGVQLAADNIDTDALSALHQVCESSGGLLWQERDGTIVYGTMYRYQVMPQWRVPCTTVMDGIQWDVSSTRVVNHVTVSWPVGAGTQQETFRDDASIAKWGYQHADVDTNCAARADALTLAGLILTRRKQPRWVMPGVVILRDQATDAEWAQIANMDFGHTAMIDVEVVPTPTPGAVTSWTVEGWVETWGATEGRRIQLALSEFRLGTPIPWSQADNQTWNYWRSNDSWLTAMVEV